MSFVKSISIFAIFVFASTSAEDVPCAYRQIGDSGVCVCNETYCDQFEFIRPTVFGKYKLVTSSKTGKRFASVEGQMDRTTLIPPLNDGQMIVDSAVQFQTVFGFGGALTGTVAALYCEMTGNIKRKLLERMFSSNGLNYTLIRTSVGGCDFDLEKYAFYENQTDLPLPPLIESETGIEETEKIISVLHDIYEVKPKSALKLFVATWSPPLWMKTCGNWSGALCFLKKQFYQAYAEYHLQYFYFLDARGVDVYCVSTGNEPSNGIFGQNEIQSLGWTPCTQARWAKYNLIPTLANSKFRHVKLLIGDDQRWEMPLGPLLLEFCEPGLMENVTYIGVHFYLDNFFPASMNSIAQALFPEIFIIVTEACQGSGTNLLEARGVILGLWARLEDNVSKYIKSLNYRNTGWIDWNMWLNEYGGPTNINNFVDAPVIVNQTKKTEFYEQPMYHGIGHFSKFILCGCKRIKSECVPSLLLGLSNIESVAFLCPDNTVTVILHNRDTASKTITVIDKVMGYQKVIILEAKSVNTMVYVYK